jgi:hypothetical protein
MYRRLGLGLMLLFLLFAFALSQRTVVQKIGYRITPDDVTTWTRECGEAIPIIFDGEYAEDITGRNARASCTREARMRLTELSFVVVVGLGCGIVGIKRGPRPPRIPIDEEIGPLPDFVPVGRRSNQW